MEQEKLKLSAPWEEVKELIKENNIELTDADLEYVPGKEDELLERLSKKMNRDKSAVRDYIESISSNRGIAS
jgi:hypothetical protein